MESKKNMGGGKKQTVRDREREHEQTVDDYCKINVGVQKKENGESGNVSVT